MSVNSSWFGEIIDRKASTPHWRHEIPVGCFRITLTTCKSFKADMYLAKVAFQKDLAGFLLLGATIVVHLGIDRWHWEDDSVVWYEINP